MLFSDFGINYNNIDPLFRKGSVLIRDYETKSKYINIDKQNNEEI